jgi:hypothetical protein
MGWRGGGGESHVTDGHGSECVERVSDRGKVGVSRVVVGRARAVPESPHHRTTARLEFRVPHVSTTHVRCGEHVLTDNLNEAPNREEVEMREKSVGSEREKCCDKPQNTE